MVKIYIAGFQFFCHFVCTTYITNNDCKSNPLSYFCITLQILCRYIKKNAAARPKAAVPAVGSRRPQLPIHSLHSLTFHKTETVQYKDTKILLLDSSLFTIHPLWHCTDNQHMNDKHLLLCRFLSLTLLMLSSEGEMFSPVYHIKLKQVHLPRRKRILYNKPFYNAVSH